MKEPREDNSERKSRVLLLTMIEAARVLSVGRTKMYELVDAGEIDVVRIGRSGTRSGGRTRGVRRSSAPGAQYGAPVKGDPMASVNRRVTTRGTTGTTFATGHRTAACERKPSGAKGCRSVREQRRDRQAPPRVRRPPARPHHARRIRHQVAGDASEPADANA